MAGLIQNKKLIGETIPWLAALREKGMEAFRQNGVPTAKTEDWKYTKPRDLNADDFVMQDSDYCECGGDCHCGHQYEAGEKCDCGCHHQNPVQFLDLPFAAYVIHFENGLFVPEHNHLPRGVTVLPLIEAIKNSETAHKNLGRLIDLQKNPFAALNTAYLEEGVLIEVEKETVLDQPLLLINHTQVQEQNLFYNLRYLVVLESGAKADLIEYYHYSGAPKSRYFANIAAEIFLGRGACLNHYKLQAEAFKANHVAFTVAQVKADAAYHNFCFQKGANIGRNEVQVRLTEKCASANVDAAYKMSGWATLDTTTLIEHLSPQTFSDQLVKGVVDGDAKGVFQGKIHISPNSVAAEGHQLHRALLLSDNAEIDCKPELEIFADDVKCSHGAASGELDEEQLFYMRSRGIDEDEARQMLVEAFLDDVLLKISNEQVRGWLKSVV